MFFSLSRILRPAESYIWVKVILIKETRKAILIEFDSRKAWIPKAWVLAIKRGKDAVRIKISLCSWAKKFG